MSKFVKSAQIRDPRQKALRERKRHWNRILYIKFKDELRQFKNVLNGKDPISSNRDPNRRIHNPFPQDVPARAALLSETYKNLMDEASNIINFQNEYSQADKQEKLQRNPFAEVTASNSALVKEGAWWGSRQWFKVKSLLPWGEREDLKKRAYLLTYASIFEDKLQEFEDKMLSTGEDSIPQGFYALNKALQYYVRFVSDYIKYVEAINEATAEEEGPKIKDDVVVNDNFPTRRPHFDPTAIRLSPEQRKAFSLERSAAWPLMNEIFIHHPERSSLAHLVNRSFFASSAKSFDEIEKSPEAIRLLFNQHKMILNRAKEMAILPEATSLVEVYQKMKERLNEVREGINIARFEAGLKKSAHKTTSRMMKRLMLGLLSNLSENDIVTVKKDISNNTEDALDSIDEVMNLLQKDDSTPLSIVNEIYDMSERLNDIASSTLLLGKDYNESAQSHNVDIFDYKNRQKIVSVTHIRYLIDYQKKIVSILNILDNFKKSSKDSNESDDDIDIDYESVRDNLAEMDIASGNLENERRQKEDEDRWGERYDLG